MKNKTLYNLCEQNKGKEVEALYYYLAKQSEEKEKVLNNWQKNVK